MRRGEKVKEGEDKVKWRMRKGAKVDEKEES